MAPRRLSEVVRYFRRLAGPASGLTDAELLERFVRCRDEAAFELLLWRHGALVLNVCRRVLRREEDIEDAFQATFLTFVRKASSIARRDSVASWLYKVAYRAALQARERAKKIAERERPGGDSLAVQPCPDPIWDDVRPILDAEVNRLPERLRRPFVLCYLEGKTNEEAARELGCRPGTIFSRLARARELLRKRLLRRGVTLSAAALTAVLSEHVAEAVPAVLLVAAARRIALFDASGPAAATISTQVTTLTEGVLRTMFVSKIKTTVLVLFAVGLLAAGGVLTRHALKAASQPEARKDPLPDHAKIVQKGEENPAAVQVVRPTPGGLERVSRWFLGHVRPSAQQQVCAAVSGRLRQPTVNLGDRVKKGDVLVEIDAPLLRVEVKEAQAAVALAKGQAVEALTRILTAEAELASAKSRVAAAQAKVKSETAHVKYRKTQLDRYQALYASRSIDSRAVDEQQGQYEAAVEAVNAAKEAAVGAEAMVAVAQSKIGSAKAVVETARTRVKMAEYALEKAEIQLERATIRANFDGIVTRRDFDAGDFVSAGGQATPRPLLTVQRTDAVRIAVNVDELDAPFVRIGAVVELLGGALPGGKLAGCKVSRTGYAIDEGTARMPIEIDVSNTKHLLRPGMSISAAIHLDKKIPASAVTVPSSCVGDGKNQPYVYVVREGKAHRTPVLVSYGSGGRVEITSGVRAADAIVADPNGLSGDVVPVEVKKAP